MILLFDIGNTHTHVGMANSRRVLRHVNLPTDAWGARGNRDGLKKFAGNSRVEGAALCSVVPKRTKWVRKAISSFGEVCCVELTSKTEAGVGIDYPRPETIGPDRLANAIAARYWHGAPVLVVDFGTAVTFDVVDQSGNYAGGVIAPGISAMTDYLHEKTALLPKIEIRDTKAVIGKNTEQAMRIGAVHGYRGLIKEIIGEIKRELKARRLPVIATGGCARLMARGIPEITEVDPLLTLEGLRLTWEAGLSEA